MGEGPGGGKFPQEPRRGPLATEAPGGSVVTAKLRPAVAPVFLQTLGFDQSGSDPPASPPAPQRCSCPLPVLLVEQVLALSAQSSSLSPEWHQQS